MWTIMWVLANRFPSYSGNSRRHSRVSERVGINLVVSTRDQNRYKVSKSRYKSSEVVRIRGEVNRYSV